MPQFSGDPEEIENYLRGIFGDSSSYLNALGYTYDAERNSIRPLTNKELQDYINPDRKQENTPRMPSTPRRINIDSKKLEGDNQRLKEELEVLKSQLKTCKRIIKRDNCIDSDEEFEKIFQEMVREEEVRNMIAKLKYEHPGLTDEDIKGIIG